MGDKTVSLACEKPQNTKRVSAIAPAEEPHLVGSRRVAGDNGSYNCRPGKRQISDGRRRIRALYETLHRPLG